MSFAGQAGPQSPFGRSEATSHDRVDRRRSSSRLRSGGKHKSNHQLDARYPRGQSASLMRGTEMLVPGRMQVPPPMLQVVAKSGSLCREGSQLCGDERSSGLCFVRSARYGYSKEPKSETARFSIGNPATFHESAATRALWVDTPNPPGPDFCAGQRHPLPRIAPDPQRPMFKHFGRVADGNS